MEFLNKISTHWTEIEKLKQQGELRELTNYLAARYFDPVAEALKKKCSTLDNHQAHALTSDVFYDFIKNDYRAVKKIERNKKLRGLFYTIIRRKLSRLPEQTPSLSEKFDGEEKSLESYMDVMIELETALERLKEENPTLYTPFMSYTFQSKKISDVSQELDITENAVKLRLRNARKFLSEYMKDF